MSRRPELRLPEGGGAGGHNAGRKPKGDARTEERRGASAPDVRTSAPGPHAGGKGAAPGGPAGGGRAAVRARKPASARDIALDALMRVEEAGAYSNLQLNRSLQEAALSRADAGLATELVYGTIQRRLTLDYWLDKFVRGGSAKLQPWVRMLLRLSVYQLAFLNRIPARAAINEAVEIAKRRGHAGVSGMVNGVLRNIDRSRHELALPDDGDPVRRISLRHSYPEWLVTRWVDVYGEAAAEAICAAGNETPRASLRVNRLRADRETVLRALREAGYVAAPSAASPWGVIVERGGHLAEAEGFRQGLWSIQDESSMLVAEAAAPEPGMTVVDCCAAPGGKSAHLAEIMLGRGTVWANDVYPHKEQLIAGQAERLGLPNIRTETNDAAALDRVHGEATMDLVLLDAPCSGFGVIRRKPEIKWTKSPGDVEAIAALQSRLLDTAARLVKPGGTLVYSTCTIERAENENQIAAFLARHPVFERDADWPAEVLAPLRRAGAADGDFRGEVQLLPQHFGSDGFYIARLKRRF